MPPPAAIASRKKRVSGHLLLICFIVSRQVKIGHPYIPKLVIGAVENIPTIGTRCDFHQLHAGDRHISPILQCGQPEALAGIRNLLQIKRMGNVNEHAIRNPPANYLFATHHTRSFSSNICGLCSVRSTPDRNTAWSRRHRIG